MEEGKGVGLEIWMDGGRLIEGEVVNEVGIGRCKCEGKKLMGDGVKCRLSRALNGELTKEER